MRIYQASFLNFVERLFLLGGICVVGFIGLALAHSYGGQLWDQWKLERVLSERTPIRLAEAEGTISGGMKKGASDQERNRPPVSKTFPLARLEIPAIHLSVMVREGTDRWTLNRAIGHIEGTANPGESGNLALAGHRDGFFRPLRNISRRDLITLTTSDGVDHYAVNNIWIVTPSDLQVLEPTDESVLTLVTCFPFDFVGKAPQRFIVRAVKIDSSKNS